MVSRANRAHGYASIKRQMRGDRYISKLMRFVPHLALPVLHSSFGPTSCALSSAGAMFWCALLACKPLSFACCRSRARKNGVVPATRLGARVAAGGGSKRRRRRAKRTRVQRVRQVKTIQMPNGQTWTQVCAIVPHRCVRPLYVCTVWVAPPPPFTLVCSAR